METTAIEDLLVIVDRMSRVIVRFNLYNEEQSKRPIRTFPYVHEVTLRGQKPPLNAASLLIFSVLFKKV